MTNAPGIPKSTVSIDDLNALNDEIASMVRAGIPLELGLRSLSVNTEHSLAYLTQRLAQRLDRGMTLPDALEAEGDHLPQIYHAIVRCGLASGSLPEALESLTGFAQSVQELRRQIAVAMLYPVFVMLLAHAIMVAFCVELFPRLKDTYQSFYLSRPSWFAFVDFLQDWIWVCRSSWW